MPLLHRYACAAGAALLSLALGLPASAQTIRSYGDSQSGGTSSGQTSGSTTSSDSSRAWYPGMPVPEQSSEGDGEQQAAPQDQEASEEGEAQESVRPSHRITIFSGNQPTPNSPRTTLDLALDQLYRGVIPGTRDEVAHLARARKSGVSQSGPNQLTWLGFRPSDEHTRVFFQTAREADYRIKRTQNPPVIKIEIENTRISARNFSRFIDTSFFGRNVKRVEARKTGNNKVDIIIELERFEQPTVRREGTYVYLDFPHAAPASGDTDGESVAGQSDSPE